MGVRSSQADNRGSDFFGFLASGKGRQFHSARDGAKEDPPLGVTATGGTKTTYTDSGTLYAVHTFNSTNPFNITATASGTIPNSIDWLVIGGGGGGGGGCGGGGGAGGYRTSMPENPGGPSPSSEPAIDAVVGNFTITVGAGGAAPGSGGTVVLGNNGSHSNLGALSVARAEGGGGGGYSGGSGASGQNGGSGGGGNYPNRTQSSGNRIAGTSTPAPNQGYGGGNAATGAAYSNGGGGGAGAVGGNVPNPDIGGNGGAGKASVISAGPGSPVTRAGGGGGGVYDPGNNAGSGGSGGGGAGSHNDSDSGGNGTTNTGSGGGGSSRNNPSKGGAGGSGVVIIRYAIHPSQG